MSLHFGKINTYLVKKFKTSRVLDHIHLGGQFVMTRLILLGQLYLQPLGDISGEKKRRRKFICHVNGRLPEEAYAHLAGRLAG